MPLSKPVPRKHIHTRAIQCTGYKREDGLWDIDGYITDTKTYSFSNDYRGGIASGEPIHHMVMRITVDTNLEIHHAEAASEFTPYSMCGDIASGFEKLKGLKIGPGWRRAVNQVMGGIHGCTHLRDLLIGPLAVTAYQTIIPIRRESEKGKAPTRKPALIGTCYAYAPDSSVVKERWPDFYEKPD